MHCSNSYRTAMMRRLLHILLRKKRRWNHVRSQRKSVTPLKMMLRLPVVEEAGVVVEDVDVDAAVVDAAEQLDAEDEVASVEALVDVAVAVEDAEAEEEDAEMAATLNTTFLLDHLLLALLH